MNTSLFYIASWRAGAGHNKPFLKTELCEKISEQRKHSYHSCHFLLNGKSKELSLQKKTTPRFNTLIPEYSDLIKHEQACIVGGQINGGSSAQLTELAMG